MVYWGWNDEFDVEMFVVLDVDDSKVFDKWKEKEKHKKVGTLKWLQSSKVELKKGNTMKLELN